MRESETLRAQFENCDSHTPLHVTHCKCHPHCIYLPQRPFKPEFKIGLTIKLPFCVLVGFDRANNAMSGVAPEDVGLEVHMKFGHSRSNCP